MISPDPVNGNGSVPPIVVIPDTKKNDERLPIKEQQNKKDRQRKPKKKNLNWTVKKKKKEKEQIPFNVSSKQLRSAKLRELRKQLWPFTSDLLPLCDYDEENECFIATYGTMDILQLRSKNLYALNEQEMVREIRGLWKFFRSYSPDIKFMALNLPVNTLIQQQYIDHRIGQTQNPVYLYYLKQKKWELQLLEKNRVNREYFIFIFAKNAQSLLDRKRSVKKKLQANLAPSEISLEKKISVLYKMSNQNSKIL